MKAYKANIEFLVLSNKNFRQVLHTSKSFQLVLMCLEPNQEIGYEVHETNDQFFRFEKGQGKAFVDDASYDLNDGDVLIVPMGAKHNIINVSESEPLLFYTLYSPPHHKDKTIHRTKSEAESDDEEFDGVTSE